jgi:hypothetical protein
VLTKIMERTDRSADCWLWTARIAPDGYAFVSAWGRTMPAHRAAYLALVGPILEGLQIDHLCRVRHCVNPAHLEPVTPRENLLRSESANARKTHCPQGHPYDEANTAWKKNGRHCRTCARAFEQARRDRMKAGAL